MSKLGKTQKAVYEFIKNFIDEHSFPPTVREIGTALDLKSTSTVHMHIKNLEQAGLVKLNPQKQRSITLVKSDADVVQVTNVALVGEVAAGTPILAVENIQEYFPLSSSFVRGATDNEVFMLNISGDSMMDIGMLDGDAIIVHNGISVNNGDIAVVRVCHETATVKRLYVESKEKIRLQPENENMPPIIADAQDVEIVGKVIGLIRKY